MQVCSLDAGRVGTICGKHPSLYGNLSDSTIAGKKSVLFSIKC